FVGGIFGSTVGVLISLGRMVLGFGTWTTAVIPLEQLMIALAGSVFLGVILAAIAAVYPSFMAARMAPMEAMRIEN
ncbi:MAG: hypothetical protein QGH33_13345, partial [Pirellulaceae bacterium]|nr:hypothetical protein [Pirellulaceae bacterium]